MPRDFSDKTGFEIDSPVEMTVEGPSIVLRKIAVHPREGWANDATLLEDERQDKEWLDADFNENCAASLRGT